MDRAITTESGQLLHGLAKVSQSERTRSFAGRNSGRVSGELSETRVDDGGHQPRYAEAASPRRPGSVPMHCHGVDAAARSDVLFAQSRRREMAPKPRSVDIKRSSRRQEIPLADDVEHVSVHCGAHEVQRSLFSFGRIDHRLVV